MRNSTFEKRNFVEDISEYVANISNTGSGIHVRLETDAETFQPKKKATGLGSNHFSIDGNDKTGTELKFIQSTFRRYPMFDWRILIPRFGNAKEFRY